MKKYHLILLIAAITLIIQCQENNNFKEYLNNFQSIHLPYQIDTTFFAKSLNYKSLNLELIPEAFHQFLKSEEFQKKHGNAFLYESYFLGKLQASEGHIGVLIYSPRSNQISLDVFIERIFLCVYKNDSGELTSISEIGRYESHFDKTIFKTFIINSNYSIQIGQREFEETDENQLNNVKHKSMNLIIRKDGVIEIEK